MNITKSIITFLISILTAVTATAIEYEGVTYGINGITKTAFVSDNRGKSGNLIVHEKIFYNGEEYIVVSINSRAFQNSTELTSITIPETVGKIGDCAFSGCTGLTEVTIPNSMVHLGDYAFSNCTGLTEVALPNSVVYLGDYAFSNCTGLTEVTIPNSMVHLGDYAFSYCKGLTEVTIPNSMAYLGERAFQHCTGLTEVTIPNSITKLRGTFYCCVNLEKITLPDMLTEIGADTFSACKKLKELTIPASVTEIGPLAFTQCGEINPLNCKASIPPHTWYSTIFSDLVFCGDTYAYSTLYVPTGCAESYRTSDVWKHFINIEEKDFSGTDDVKITDTDFQTPVEYYNLQGVRVNKPSNGIYIIRQGGKSYKQLFQ